LSLAAGWFIIRGRVSTAYRNPDRIGECLIFQGSAELKTGEQKMDSKLKKTYFVILLPPVLGFITVCLAKANYFLTIGSLNYIDIWAPSIFFLSVTFALALPIFYRTFYAHRNRHAKSLSEEDLVKFERNLIYIALVTPYFSLTAFLLELPRFYTAGSILMGIYAVYYFYPSQKRIALDRRIFRVV
jgi:predicted membrane channel-forming protein YqfA (hemolysin III family)